MTIERYFQLYVPDDPSDTPLPLLTVYRRPGGSPLAATTISGLRSIKGRTTANYPEVSGSSFRPIDFKISGYVLDADVTLFEAMIALQEQGYRVLVINNYRPVSLDWISWNNRAIYGESFAQSNGVIAAYYQYYGLIVPDEDYSQWAFVDGGDWNSLNFTIYEVPGSGAIGQGEVAGTADTANVLTTGTYQASASLTAPAAITLNGSDQWVYATASNADHKDATIALLTTSVSSGALTNGLANGMATNSSWNWTLGNGIYLGLNGALTQTIPSAPNFRKQVATPLSSTVLYWNPQAGVAQS